MSYSEIHGLIREVVESREVEYLQETIELLELDSISRYIYSRYLAEVVKLCYDPEDLEHSRVFVVEAIRVFELHNEGAVPIVSYIYTVNGLDDSVYAFVAECHPSVDYYEHMTNLFSYSVNDVDIYASLDRLHRIMGPQTKDMYDSILEALDRFFNDYEEDLTHFRAYIRQKRKELKIPAEKEHVIRARVPTHSELMLSIEEYRTMKPVISGANVGQIISNTMSARGEQMIADDPTLTTADIHREGGISEAYSDVIGDALSIQIDESLVEEDDIEEMVRVEGGDEISKEAKIEVFRVLGPCNPPLSLLTYRKDDAINEYNQCRCFGGCRMLTCWEYSIPAYNEEEEDVIEYDVDWFTGSCDECDRIIKHKHEAVRVPIKTGGWAGCYHSWDCAMANIDDAVQQIETERFKRQHSKYGVYEREWSAEKEQQDVSEELFIASYALLEGCMK